MMAFEIIRGGYRARAHKEERSMLASLVRDVVVLLGSDVEHEAERRAQQFDPNDPLEPDSTYSVTVTDWVSGKAGGLDVEGAPVSWTFTTAGRPSIGAAG